MFLVCVNFLKFRKHVEQVSNKFQKSFPTLPQKFPNTYNKVPQQFQNSSYINTLNPGVPKNPERYFEYHFLLPKFSGEKTGTESWNFNLKKKDYW